MKKTFLYILAAGFFGGLTLMSFDGGAAQTAEQQIAAKVDAAKVAFMAEQDAACKAKALAAAQTEFAAAAPVVEEPVVDPKTGKPSKTTKPAPTPTTTTGTTSGTQTATTTTTTTTTKPVDPKTSKISGDKTTTTDAKTSKISGEKTTTTDAKTSKISGGK